ncbi:MAG: hypothetical protein ACOVRB_09795 [Akkermansiaceae bacterium]
MKPTQWFILGTAIAACAVASGLFLATQRNGSEEANSATALDKAKPTRSRPALRSNTAPVSTDSTRNAERLASQFDSNTVVQEPMRVTGSPAPNQRQISEAEWLARAAKVEREANHELALMTESLGLSAMQQQRIFDILARGSAAWLPGMQTGVDSSPDESTDPIDYLTSEQYDSAVKEELDRQEWWAEVLPTLLPPETDTGTTIPETPPDTKPIDD